MSGSKMGMHAEEHALISGIFRGHLVDAVLNEQNHLQISVLSWTRKNGRSQTKHLLLYNKQAFHGYVVLPYTALWRNAGDHGI